ncbi:MAG: aminotransferase class V-fold PLP-dependent enzyme [Cytophagaceae bacterium]|jgi:phosphoserine aminotransferase|nr:aminotransferase class V-fold PLP-dependent enzyme [Cytophagaceae bacterium]
MSKTFFTVGPSQLYPTLPQHIQEALDKQIGTISHRGKQFQSIYKHATDGLRTLLSIPEDFEILFLSSATEIWERIIENCVEQHSFHCVNGSFSKRFYEFSVELGKTAVQAKAEFGSGFYAADLQIPSQTEIICLTQNETSSGVKMPVSEINKVKSKHSEALIFVDAVSSIPYPQFDFSVIDSVFFSVQKCFGLPAGLGVWILNKRVIAKAEAMLAKGIKTGTYHTIPSLLSKAKDFQTPETPNVWNIFLLGKVVEDFNKKGIEVIRKETDTKAKMLYDFLGKSSVFTYGVTDAALRSDTTIVANTSVPSGEVIKKLEAEGLVPGSGYSSYKEKQIRIANFPAISIQDTESLIQALQKHYA